MILRFRIAFLFLCTLSLSSRAQVAFIVTSDTHFDGDSTNYAVNKMMAEDFNRLQEIRPPGSKKRLYPGFVWVLGDLTDSGTEDQWEDYEEIYGLKGEGVVQYPVFECFGNHDGNIDGVVRTGIRKRNKKREMNINTDTLGLHYSWDMGGIHFVNLNLYPANEWDPDCDWCKYFKESFREAQNSLEFLEKDLLKRVGASGIPVVIAFHIGYDDFGKLWWTDSDREKFWNVINGYNVAAIFHGHNHAVEKRNWKGIDVWAVGSPQHGDKTGSYLVVEADRNGEIVVFEREYGQWKSGVE